jgi:hypothetical protein
MTNGCDWHLAALGIERNGRHCSASEAGIGRMSSGVPPRLRPTSLVAPPGRIIHRRTDHESWSPHDDEAQTEARERVLVVRDPVQSVRGCLIPVRLIEI